MATRRPVRINVLVDWSEAFVDPNGSFYSGTSLEEKAAAAKILRACDRAVYTCDVHHRGALEFVEQGGLYPAHNLLKRDEPHPSPVYSGKSTSCLLTKPLQDVIDAKGWKAAVIVPRCAQFQAYNGDSHPAVPAYTVEDVEATFGAKSVDPARFGEYPYVISAKSEFNGVSLYSTAHIGPMAGVNDTDYNAFTLYRKQYGLGEGVDFLFTGTVLGICVFQSASNAKQMFPKANVCIIHDACTQLLGEDYGMPDAEFGLRTVRAMCAQIGVKFMTAEQYLGSS
ncbi:hypothetical protein Pelo_9401 [Pelomyxa schiedti]|nr:hypothetical protein Pelo_9401 [Pelomyxa schiedti]